LLVEVAVQTKTGRYVDQGLAPSLPVLEVSAATLKRINLLVEVAVQTKTVDTFESGRVFGAGIGCAGFAASLCGGVGCGVRQKIAILTHNAVRKLPIFAITRVIAARVAAIVLRKFSSLFFEPVSRLEVGGSLSIVRLRPPHV
jgi:hypothetical protein